MLNLKEKKVELKGKQKFIKLTNDKLFKVTFGAKANRKFLEDLLECYYGYPKGYLKDKLESSYEVTIDKPRYHEKDTRNDIVVKFDNTYINIEMYKIFNDLAYDKSEFYVMRICTNQVLIGDSYKMLNKVTQINFIEHDTINISEDLRTTKQLSRKSTMDFVILDKLPNKSYNEDRFYKYLRMFIAESFEELERIAKGDEILMEIADWVKAYQGNDNPKYFNDDYWNTLIYRHEGEKDSKKEIAKNMLAKDMKDEDISEITGLSLVEINKLKENTSE